MRSRWIRALMIILAAAALAAGQKPGTGTSTASLGAPPGRMLDVGGHRLHLYCTGTGSPTVVIDAGAGNWSIFYTHLQAEIKDTRVCVYDRAGLGWSEPGPTPRTSSRMADELHTLLHRAGVAPPLVLVGHSLGGYNVRIYQHRYPEEVAALVLVESAHEKQWERLPPEVAQFLRLGVKSIRARAEQARNHEIDASKIDLGFVNKFAPRFRDAYLAAMLNPKQYEAWADETESAFDSAAQVPGGSLGDLPLIVLTAENSFETFRGAPFSIEKSNAVWMDLQNELAALSKDSTHLLSTQGAHDINKSDPAAFVSAIKLGIDAARKRQNSPAGLGLRGHSLPLTSTAAVDGLLLQLEESYRSMDTDRFVSLFAEDFSQLDVNRRVHIKGLSAFTEQTRRVIAAHSKMDRRHYGRGIVGDWVVAEIEWSGTVRGEVLGTPGKDRQYRYTGLGLIKIQDGKIQQQILYGDYATLTEQLDAVSVLTPRKEKREVTSWREQFQNTRSVSAIGESLFSEESCVAGATRGVRVSSTLDSTPAFRRDT